MDKALTLTTTKLKAMSMSSTSRFGEEAKYALKWPIYKTMPRFMNRNNISLYQNNPLKNNILLSWITTLSKNFTKKNLLIFQGETFSFFLKNTYIFRRIQSKEMKYIYIYIYRWLKDLAIAPIKTATRMIEKNMLINEFQFQVVTIYRTSNAI